MKISAILLVSVLFVAATAADDHVQPQEPVISDLGWMSGCWVQKGKNKDSYVSENWTKPLGMMIGTNRSVRDSKVRAFEYLRIERREDGIYYVAKPWSASAETGFKLKSIAKKHVVFENKEHDFPKRILYSRKGEFMAARVEDDNKGFALKFVKVSCDE